MQKQNASNHVRYYPAHHFIFYPLLLIAISVSVYKYIIQPGQQDIWLALAAAFLFTGWLSFMMRQHYALGNQDRLVRLELRFRYFLITGKRLEPIELKLRLPQLAALRFASDDELPGLVDRAIQENLSPRQIKNAIVHWLPDYMRV
jgi:hypothetical protein